MKKYLKLLSKVVKKHGKSAILLAAGVLAGILFSAPAAQAAAQLLANPSSQTFYLDGQKIDLTAYEIGGNNYVKLRDVGRMSTGSASIMAAVDMRQWSVLWFLVMQRIPVAGWTTSYRSALATSSS